MLWLWSLSISVAGQGPEGHAMVHHFDRQDMGGSLASLNIVALRNDAVAVANGEGIILHDGGIWQLIPLPNSTSARSIAPIDGTWLCGGQNFIGKLLEDGSFEDWTPQVMATGHGFEDVWRLYITGAKWFMGTSDQVGAFDATGRYELLQAGPITNSFRVGKQDVGWQIGDTMYVWDGNAAPQRMVIPSDLRVEAVLPGEPWRILSHERGVWERKDGIWSESKSALSETLKGFRTNCILPGNAPGNWWIGTSTGGILLTEDLHNVATRYDQTSGLTSNTVLSMSADDRGNLWAATEGGIDLMRLNWPVRHASPQAIASHPGYASLHDGERIFWATSQGLFVETSGKVHEIQGLKGPVWSVERHLGAVWVGHLTGGGYLDDSLQYHSVISERGVWGFHLVPGDSSLLAGTFEGLEPVSKHAGEWESAGLYADFKETARFVGFDAADTVWVSHPYRGAYRLAIHPETHRVEKLGHYAEHQGFPSPMDIYLGQVDGALLFATTDGICTWNPTSDQIQPAAGNWSNFLNPDGAYRLIQSGPGGSLWAFEDAVLIRFGAERQELSAGVQVVRAPLTDAAPIPGFERLEFLSDGRVCAPTEQGFVYIDPARMLAAGDAPTVQVGSVFHLNHPEGTQALPLDDIHLPAGAHALQIQLVSDDSRWTGRLMSQWRIAEVSEEWSAPQADRTITLNGLKPGTHHVEFRALANNSLTGPPTALTIKIAAPWYELWVFRASVVLIILLAAWLGLRRNKARLEREHAAATERQKAEIEAVENRLATERLEFAQSQVSAKNAELASVTMNLVQKAQLVQTVQTSLRKIRPELPQNQQKEIDQLLKIIQDGGRLDDAWEQFTQQFDQVHIDFHQRLTERFPDLTKNDIKLCSYLRMGLSTKEIASLMFVTVRAVEVSRSRLRKRLDLLADTKLTSFIQNL